MQIFLSNNIKNLERCLENSSICKTKFKINQKLLNIFELMAILHQIMQEIKINSLSLHVESKVTFSEFCAINFFLEAISNKFADKLLNKLLKKYMHVKIFKEIIDKIDEFQKGFLAKSLTNSGTTAVSSSGLEKMSDDIIGGIEEKFFKNNFFMKISQCCISLLKECGQSLKFPEVRGKIDDFNKVYHIHYYVKELQLISQINHTLNTVTTTDKLFWLIYSHSLFFEEIYCKNPGLFEARAIAATSLQVSSNCLESIFHFCEIGKMSPSVYKKLNNIINESKMFFTLRFINSIPRLDEEFLTWYKDLKNFVTSYRVEIINPSITGQQIPCSVIDFKAEESIKADPSIPPPSYCETEERVDILSLTIDNLVEKSANW